MLSVLSLPCPRLIETVYSAVLIQISLKLYYNKCQLLTRYETGLQDISFCAMLTAHIFS